MRSLRPVEFFFILT